MPNQELKFINLRRLPVALIVLAGIILPVYFLFLRQDATLEEGFNNAILLDTPASAEQQKVGLRPGELAPNFEISTPEGKRVRLTDFRGKPVLINFFALWCGSCLSEMPDVKEIQEQRGVDSLTVLAINTGETRTRALDFINFIEAPFVWALDFNLTVTDAYGVRGLPATFYIDANGIVRAVYTGQAEKERLNAYVDAAFKAGDPPSFPLKLRLISDIPRDRVLFVNDGGQGTIQVTSRSLRCDASYCAEPAMNNLRQFLGIESANIEAKSSQEPRLAVRYDPAVITQEQVVQRLAAELSALKDPVYTTELEIRYSARP